MKILIVFVLSILVLGFSCKEDHVEQPFDIIYVEGIILDSLTNDPIQNATISLRKSGGFFNPPILVREAYSNQYGKFKIDYTTDAEGFTVYSLDFSKPEYYSRRVRDVETGKKQSINIKLLKQ